MKLSVKLCLVVFLLSNIAFADERDKIIDTVSRFAMRFTFINLCDLELNEPKMRVDVRKLIDGDVIIQKLLEVQSKLLLMQNGLAYAFNKEDLEKECVESYGPLMATGWVVERKK